MSFAEEKKVDDHQEDGLIQGLTTCVVGGGSSAHVLIPLLAEAGHRMHLLTRRPDDWGDDIYCDMTDGDSGLVTSTHCGTLSKKSSDPAEVIPEADIIVLCMPVHQYRPALIRLAPYVSRDKPVFIGTIYGQGGFNWMVHSDVEKKYGLNNITTFAIGSIPWICRTTCYGHRSANYGSKDLNLVAVSPSDQFDKLNNILLNDISFRPFNRGKFRQVCSFVSLTMSVDNQVLHPARCFGLWKRYKGVWEDQASVPFFYKDFDELSADILKNLDADYTNVRNAIKKHFPDRPFQYMLNYTDLEKLNHNSSHVDILASLRDSKQLASIKTPSVEGDDGRYRLDTDFRFFTDDIPYGLLIAKWFAERLNVATPHIDEVITWAQNLRGESFLDANGKINLDFCLKEKCLSGIPEAYGFSSLTEDLLD